MNITNQMHDKRYTYPIAYIKRPVVICTNVTTNQTDYDGWVTSGTYNITNTQFTYQSAQNQTSGFHWLSIGK